MSEILILAHKNNSLKNMCVAHKGNLLKHQQLENGAQAC